MTVAEPHQLPYLVTEFAGHMFPTKSFDSEERQLAHVLLHAKIHNEQYGMDNVPGASGWCALDYNTHVDFGSGDRICYHGAMDIFRQPKFAAHFYRSQKDPHEEAVLFPAMHLTQGDLSAGGISPLTIFSNCDTMDIYMNN